MCKTRFLTSAAMILGMASSAFAQDVYMFRDQVPTADEIAGIMFPAPPAANATSSEPAQPQIRTRGIRFTAEPAAAASTSSQQSNVADSQSGDRPPAPKGSIVGFNITFALNSAELTPQAMPYLDRLGEALTLPAASGKTVRIGGHADASGGAAHNRQLSEARAESVRNYLERRFNIPESRLQVVGYGENYPLPGTDPFDGVNRRVEFEPIN